MPELVAVVKFADDERAVLTGDAGDRTTWAKNVGSELTTMVKGVHKSVRDVGATNPGRQDLQDLVNQLNEVDTILGVLPESESVSSLRSAQRQMREIVDQGLTALAS